MRLPAFTIEGMLPPFDAHSGARSPYPTDLPQLIETFGSTPNRRNLIGGLLRYRATIRGLGGVGFQWISGSFIEHRRLWQPRDLDVVSFVGFSSNDPIERGDLLVRL